MRILFLSSRDWKDPKACGGDLCTGDYARYLAARGHEVTLIARRYPVSAAEQVMEGVRIIRPGALFFLAWWAFTYYLRHRNEFDVVYEEGMASVRLPYLAPLYVRKPLVAMWYQVNAPIFSEQYPRLVAWLLTWAERLVLALHRRCKILTLSTERKAEIVALGFSPGQVELLPPLMLDSFPPEAPERARAPLIVWLGKIRRYKCAHHAIQAMPEVVAQVPEARLVIAGRRDDEGYEAELLNLARRLGVNESVEVRVGISDDEKWELLSQARGLAVTSPLEGFGIVVVEANRCGTPVVVTEGIPNDTVKIGYNGIRVPFGDRQALASALVRLLADRAVFATLSGNARRHAAQFSRDEAGRRLEEAFVAATARAA